MAPRRTSRVNDHKQRKLDIAKSQMREYLLVHMIDAAVSIKADGLLVTVYQSCDAQWIPSTSRGVRVETHIELLST